MTLADIVKRHDPRTALLVLSQGRAHQQRMLPSLDADFLGGCDTYIHIHRQTPRAHTHTHRERERERERKEHVCTHTRTCAHTCT
jgi:hypothetical protein